MFLGQRGATKLAAGVGFELPEILQYPHPDMYPHPEGHDRQDPVRNYTDLPATLFFRAEVVVVWWLCCGGGA